jgi:hypothetical protein
MILESTFRKRVEGGEPCTYSTRKGESELVVSVLKVDAKIWLTWEEFPPGELYNDHLFTRDERYSFDTYEALVQFLTQNQLRPEQFGP